MRVRKQRNKFIRLGVAIVLAALACPRISGAAIWTEAQKSEIDCAEQKMQLFYHYFSSNKSQDVINGKIKCKGGEQKIVMPKWLDEQLPAMLEKKVWRDPSEGELSEAALWQTHVAMLYEFCNLTRKTFPTKDGVSGIPPRLLVQEYANLKMRHQVSLDRVYRARLYDSMQGRGRGMLASFTLIFKETETLMNAVANNNDPEFVKSATAIAVLSQDTFGQLFQAPRLSSPPPVKDTFSGILVLLLTIVGALIIFFGLSRILSGEDEGVNKLAAKYMEKVRQWTYDYNRQFLAVKIHHLVLLPIIVFGILGALTFNINLFLACLVIGAYLGLHTPEWTLNFLKERRGKKIDAQLMDALILLSNSLKSGMDIVQGFELVAQDLQPPISDEFGLVIKNYQLGTPFEKALEGMEERVASRLLAYMIRAVVLQRQVGGNLTKIFERIVENIREEGKLEEKTRALTAQQKIQSVVVGIMPWVLLVIMFVFQGETMSRFYFSPLGMSVLIFCMVWVGIGVKVVQAMGKIRV